MAKFESEESAFNFAMEYLMQISKSLTMCNIASTSKNPEMWIDWLRVVFRQLSCKTSETEDEEINKYFREINRRINNPELKITKKHEILYLEDQLEMKLRKLLQQKGMLLPSKNDPAFAVGKR